MNDMKLIRSFAFAWNGLKICFSGEPNFRIHILFAIVVLIPGIVFNISVTEWIVIGFCIAFVISMEMLNTAIEKLCDVVHKELHPDIKRVKDIAAGAVLVSAIFSLMTGLIIFLPKIILYFKSL
jgi:diacylglycerol kinase